MRVRVFHTPLLSIRIERSKVRHFERKSGIVRNSKAWIDGVGGDPILPQAAHVTVECFIEGGIVAKFLNDVVIIQQLALTRLASARVRASRWFCSSVGLVKVMFGVFAWSLSRS